MAGARAPEPKVNRRAQMVGRRLSLEIAGPVERRGIRPFFVQRSHRVVRAAKLEKEAREAVKVAKGK